MIVAAGSTDVTTYFVLRLAADGTEITGATITDIDLQYVRSGAEPSAKVDATALAATDSAHADNKAIEIDGTDQPGLYRVDWPDAAFAAGAREVILSVKYATAFTEHLRVELSPAVDAIALSGDTGAADNAESFFDGTGYAGTNNTIPTVTAVTNTVNAAVTSIGNNVITSAAINDGAITNAKVADDVDVNVKTITAGAIVAASFASGALDAVWSTATRTLTSYGSLVSDIATAVWAAGTRTLTSFGSLVSDVATAVWGAVTRTLTATSAPSDMAKESTLTAIKGAGWSASTDTLEAIRDAIPSAPPTVSDIRTELEGVGTHLTAIKAKTDNLPADPAGVSDLPSEPPSAGDIAGAVLDEPLGAHTGLIATNLDAKVSEVEASVDLTPVTDMLDEIKGATWSGSTDTLEEISDAIADISPAGGDTIAFAYTVTRSGSPVEGALVRFCSDAGYVTEVKTGYTNALGVVTMNVPAGTYYITVDAPGQARAYDSEVVS